MYMYTQPHRPNKTQPGSTFRANIRTVPTCTHRQRATARLSRTNGNTGGSFHVHDRAHNHQPRGSRGRSKGRTRHVGWGCGGGDGRGCCRCCRGGTSRRRRRATRVSEHGHVVHVAGTSSGGVHTHQHFGSGRSDEAIRGGRGEGEIHGRPLGGGNWNMAVGGMSPMRAKGGEKNELLNGSP